MTRKDMADYLKHLQAKEDWLREQGQKEYAHEEDNAFANFERISARLPNVSREQVLLVYLLKHIDGIIAYVNNPNMEQRDEIEGRIGDARVYLALLGGMFADKDNTLPYDKTVEYPITDTADNYA